MPKPCCGVDVIVSVLFPASRTTRSPPALTTVERMVQAIWSGVHANISSVRRSL
jgi:hypothetical protein